MYVQKSVLTRISGKFYFVVTVLFIYLSKNIKIILLSGHFFWFNNVLAGYSAEKIYFLVQFSTSKTLYFHSGRRMEIHNHPKHPQHNPKHHHLWWPTRRQSSLRLHGGGTKHPHRG